MVKLALAIVVALVSASMQCVASCTFLETAPPCHHHNSGNSTMSACSHEIVMDKAQEVVSAVPVVPPALPLIDLGTTPFEMPLLAASFPVPPQFNLRI